MANLANHSAGREKLFVGGRLRHIRAQQGLSQAQFAAELGLSASYVNQLEHDQRPVSAGVLLKLSDVFGIDIAALSNDAADRMAADLREALADPVYGQGALEPQLTRRLAATAPELAMAFLNSHRLNQKYEERLRMADSSFERDAGPGPATIAAPPLPYEEVRDYFHYKNNYLDRLDRAAERLSMRYDLYGPFAFERLSAHLEGKHRFSVRRETVLPDPETMYAADMGARVVRLNGVLSQSTLTFQLAALIGVMEEEEAIADLLAEADFRTDQARDICRISLANYFAGAVMMPYKHFAENASSLKHDIERLQQLYGASFEQVCHRLSNLQRPGAAGTPFFFVRVDQAGNITKRHSATKFQFARFGGACPLWNVHDSFGAPGKILVQIAETPDGVQYISIARSIIKRAGRYDGFDRRYAVALGCELKHADAVIYAEGVDIAAPRAATPIGVSCRICERPDCRQRAFPPIDRALSADPFTRNFTPYAIV
ncbi:MAG: short-chain fatty acyl-CoA regulator family protein [Pseudomonadota bacterium]